MESHRNVFDKFRGAKDEGVPRIIRTIVGKYAQRENERRRGLILSASQYPMRLQFQLSQGFARHNARFAMHTM